MSNACILEECGRPKQRRFSKPRLAWVATHFNFNSNSCLGIIARIMQARGLLEYCSSFEVVSHAPMLDRD